MSQRGMVIGQSSGTIHSYSCNNINSLLVRVFVGKVSHIDRTVLIYSSEVTWGEAIPAGYQYHHCLFSLFLSLC